MVAFSHTKIGKLVSEFSINTSERCKTFDVYVYEKVALMRKLLAG